ncbi:hypothetical protein FHT43_006834 [Mycolicibacterium sp. BK607]|uniref:DUF2510 domain-containing protein n=1 Tax=Mycolicibacterium sp. BK607 TaxID=2587098 RepID=UPI0016129791|nr:DUF2510 domain-containing protein [Mycolicibacterium sp. BK607]MBB3636886.1 hypothetical protein [Mycolicibacterium sp. BK607]
MDVLAGWYPDPTAAAAYRFWDGRQWTSAVATAPVAAVPAPHRDWCQRHPAWTTLIVFWVACLIWQWEWLVPVAAIAATVVTGWRWARRRRARLAADADRQNAWALAGDERGVFGDFLPVAATENQ